jgi:addiction module RelE/StbE family toxin
MSFRIVPSKRFQKTVRTYRKGGRKKIIAAITEILQLLAAHDDRALFLLTNRWRDHALKGNMQGARELHVSQDDLLLYTVDEELGIIKLLDIVNHEELRRQ